MALVACSECGKQVSDSAVICPHCGVAAPALSVKEKAQVTVELRRASYGRIGGWVFFIGIAWVLSPMLTGGGRDAIVSAWGPAKYLIFGGLLAYIAAEIERNLALRRASKK